MKCSFFLLSSFALYVSSIACLSISVSPTALANSPTLVAWTGTDAENANQLTFDLRFVQNDADVGLALANLDLDEDTGSGTSNVVFPSAGTFVLKAVTGNTNVGTSNKVVILPPLTTTATPTASSTSSGFQLVTTTLTSSSSGSTTTGAVSTTAPPSSSGSVSTSATSSVPSSSRTAEPISRLVTHTNLAALVGGIIGALVGLALLVVLFIYCHRKRNTIRKRLTFNRDMMVQRRLSRAPTLPPLDPRASESFARDVEQGLPVDANADSDSSTEHLVPPRYLGTGHIVPSPKGPRPSMKHIATVTVQRSVGSPLSSSRPSAAALASASAPPAPTPTPAPIRTRRQQELLDRSAMLRRQMADLKLELDRLSLRSTSLASPSIASPVTIASSVLSAPNGRAAEIRAVLDDMQRQMVWIRAQEGGAWAMEQTDVLPPGHERYLRP